jgi:phosphoenolpyruvate phosphomutase
MLKIMHRLFPKQNSLLEGGRKEQLAPIDEFTKKIIACKEHQRDPDFQVVARVEALIAGWGLDEALKRAEAYRAAGADAILIHSKKKDSAEIEAFAKKWNNRHPLILVPTKYYKTPTQKFKEWNISMVIWANHNMRSCISAMKETSKMIFDAQSLVPVEKEIASVEEVFRLQNNHELVAADKKYL